MGWGLGDDARIVDARVNLSLTRSAFYILRKYVLSIAHEEKRGILAACADSIERALDEMERTLNR